MRYYPVATRRQELDDLRTRLADPETGHPATCGCGSSGTYTEANRAAAERLAGWTARIVTPYGAAVHAATNSVTRCAMSLKTADKRLPHDCTDVTCDRCLHTPTGPVRPVGRSARNAGAAITIPTELEPWQMERLAHTITAAHAGSHTAAARALRILGVDRRGVDCILTALWPAPDGR